jgi:protein-disulfide isomerase
VKSSLGRSPFRTVTTILGLLACLLASCGGQVSSSPKPESAPPVAAPAPAPTDAAEDDAVIPIGRDDGVRGSRVSFVTIVVFSDFQCPFCSKLDATFDRLREEYGGDKLRIVFKNNPLPFHPHARLAAEVGQGVLALAGQEAFWRYQTTAFREQANMSPEAVRAWAVAAGADARALEQGLEARRWAPKIERDLELAKRLDVHGTPESFVNGVAVSGAQPFERFKEVIDAELEKASALVNRGVRREEVYARLVAASFKADRDAEAAAREAAEIAETKIVNKIPIGASPTRGPATAPVTIVVFSDFQCPFCKRAEETLARIRREYGDKVRIAWRDMPLSFHARAEPAAELGRAARAQKGDAGFWAVHDLLFDAQPKLEEQDLERIARDAQLDVPKAMAAVKSKTFKKSIEDDIDLGDDFQASATPHFFVNGRRVVGAKPFEKFKPIIDEEIAKAEGLLRAGTPPADLYDALVKDGKTPAEPVKRAIGAAPPGAPFRGAANAKVVIQEVGDFQCPFCKRADATMDELLKAYPGKIKIVWRDKPLEMHRDAALAAEAAREAFAQKGTDGFTKMRRALFDNQRALERGDLDGYAKEIGLDTGRFGRALDAHVHKALIDADDKATDDAGVSGTPAFFIGPYYVSGAAPYARFRRLVELVLHQP